MVERKGYRSSLALVREIAPAHFGYRASTLLCFVLLGLLSGCGGDGGGGAPLPIPPPPPPTVPPPPPPPPPPPNSAFDTAEYRQSNGAVAANAIVGYQDGASGSGVKIAIIDGGINPALAEFAGRIDPASRDVVANRTVPDGRHATAVTAIAAAAKNDLGIQGVAYAATIVALRADVDCGAPPCGFSPLTLSTAIDAAVAAGARVINMSVGGPGGTDVFLNAIDRATKAGIVVVLAAGNDGAAQPDGTALISAQNSGSLVVIAGAHDATNTISGFSNRAGPGANFYLTALGSNVNTIDENGQPVSLSGTSVSTPIISGAVALLANAFPNLTGGQIVDILYKSAVDAGAPGVDPIYGRGILDIGRAFQPIGALSLPGAGKQPFDAVQSAAVVSTPMGDASPRLANLVMLDSYSRAYMLELGSLVRPAPFQRPLAQALSDGISSISAGGDLASVSMRIVAPADATTISGVGGIGPYDAGQQRPRVVSTLVIARPTSFTSLAYGVSETGEALRQELGGVEEQAFIVAPGAFESAAFFRRAMRSMAVRQKLGRVAVTITSENGRVFQPIKRIADGSRYLEGTAAFEADVGQHRFLLGVRRLDEDGTVLGAWLGNLIGASGAATWTVDAGGDFGFAGNWRLSANYRRSSTSIRGNNALTRGGMISSDAWSLEVSKQNVMRTSDSVAVRVEQPLRVRAGGIRLIVPTGYDYVASAATYEPATLNLTPSGREVDIETLYSMSFPRGNLTLNGYVRRQAGNVSRRPIDVGAAIRIGRSF